MRRLQICLSLFLVATCLGQSGNVNLKPLPGMQLVNRTHRLSRGLIGYWLMNERSGPTAFDLSGYGNTGTLSGNTSWVSGKYGSGIDFSGVDYAEINAPLSLSAGEPELTVIISFRLDEVGRRQGIALDPTNYAFRLNVYEGGYFRGLITTGDGPFVQNLTGTIEVNTQYVLALSYKAASTSCVYYINGVYNITDTITGAILEPASLRIGRWIAGRTFHGVVDYVMIYNRALSASEIALLYREPFCMFKHGNIELMAKEAEAPAPTGGQVIMISSIPLIFIIGFCFIMRRSNGKAA